MQTCVSTKKSVLKSTMISGKVLKRENCRKTGKWLQFAEESGKSWTSRGYPRGLNKKNANELEQRERPRQAET